MPSPWTSSGAPASARSTKRGITIPYWPDCFGPDGVEEAGDDAVEPALLVEAEREELVDRLRVRVEPAAFGRRGRRRAGRSPTSGALLAVVAVDLRARRDEHALVELVAVLEHGLGAAARS